MRITPIARLAGLIGLAVALNAAAQTVITPAQPTEQSIITARSTITTTCSQINVQTVVTGAIVRTTIVFRNCLTVTAFFLPVDAVFGPIPAGSYTYEVFVGFGSVPPELFSTQPLVIAAVPDPIPTLSEWGLIVLAGVVAVVGVLAAPRVIAG